MLAAVRQAAAAELLSDPVLRREVRARFLSRGYLSTVPTQKGVAQVDWQHEFFPYVPSAPSLSVHASELA